MAYSKTAQSGLSFFYQKTIRMNIYIGNLHPHMSEAQVRDLFKKFGTVVSVTIIMDTETGHTKGFGFVEMDDPRDGQKAIAELNNQNFMGNYLEVAEARPRPEKENKFLIDARKQKSQQNNNNNKRQRDK